ncbi:MAG: hypothetical protein ACFFGZ_06635 [Candidatus Thorarchaeota archaeon]
MSSGSGGSNFILWAIVIGAVVLSAAAIGWIVINEDVILSDDNDNENAAPLTLIGVDQSEETVYLSDLKELDAVEGNSQYENRFGNMRGYGLYKGVTMALVIEIVGGMQEGDSLLVTASDGYWQRFSYYNVYPGTDWKNAQGDMVLAYSHNNTEVPDWEDGYRLAFLPSDGTYSNDDFNATTTPESRQAGSSAGSRWVSTIVEVIVERSWNVSIAGSRNETLNMQQLQQFPEITNNGSMSTSVGISGPYNFTGVSLELFVSFYVAPGVNYTVTVIANDSWSRTLTKEQVEGNMTLYDSNGDSIGYGNATPVLAYAENGEQLPYLRLVFLGSDNPITKSGYWVKFVVRLEIQVV